MCWLIGGFPRARLVPPSCYPLVCFIVFVLRLLSFGSNGSCWCVFFFCFPMAMTAFRACVSRDPLLISLPSRHETRSTISARFAFASMYLCFSPFFASSKVLISGLNRLKTRDVIVFVPGFLFLRFRDGGRTRQRLLFLLRFCFWLRRRMPSCAVFFFPILPSLRSPHL